MMRNETILWKPVPAPAVGRSRDAPRRGGCPRDTRGIACRPQDPGTETKGEKGSHRVAQHNDTYGMHERLLHA